MLRVHACLFLQVVCLARETTRKCEKLQHQTKREHHYSSDVPSLRIGLTKRLAFCSFEVGIEVRNLKRLSKLLQRRPVYAFTGCELKNSAAFEEH